MAPTKVRTEPRNPNLVPGIKKHSGSKMYHKRGLWAINAKNGGKLPTHQPKPAAAQPDAPEKAPKFYPAGDVEHYTRNCVDPSGWEVYGEESCVPQAAPIWIAPRHWNVPSSKCCRVDSILDVDLRYEGYKLNTDERERVTPQISIRKSAGYS